MLPMAIFPHLHIKYMASLVVHCPEPESSLNLARPVVFPFCFDKITTVTDWTWDFSVLCSKSS